MEKRTFNLLKPIAPPKGIWDKVYDWILGRARVVILITEILIAVAFFAKVIQDTDAKNKDREIERLNSELSFYSQTLEPQYRLQERKDNTYVSTWNASTKYSEVISEIYTYIPNSASEINLRIDGNRVIIFGTENLSTLQQLEAALKSSATFSAVAIENLTIEQQALTEQKGDYVLTAVIKEHLRDQI